MQKAQSNAARIGEQIVYTDLQRQRFFLDQQIQQSVPRYEQYRSALAYYEENDLLKAALIQTKARGRDRSLQIAISRIQASFSAS